MQLIIGLGNPGDKYKNTRHNLGYLVIDELLERAGERGVEVNASVYKKIATCYQLKDCNIVLAKPLTYMNKSGLAARQLMKRYNIEPADICVVHDDLDFAVGKYETQKGKSSAGHKGVESIIRALETKDFYRVRVGIGKPVVGTVEDYVLEKFPWGQRVLIRRTIKQAAEELERKFIYNTINN